MKKINVFMLILLALIFAGISVKARGNFDVPDKSSGSAALSPVGVDHKLIMTPLTLNQIFETQFSPWQVQITGDPMFDQPGVAAGDGRGVAITTTINPGSDLWAVPCATFSFGPNGDYPALPAGFFGPGSDPFDGIISFKGQNSDGSKIPASDMTINRLEGAVFSEPYPISNVLPLEEVSMSLISSSPIVIRSEGIDSFFDIWTELSLDAPHGGTANVTMENPHGGSFTQQLTFTPIFTFVEVGNPSHTIVFNPASMGYGGISYSSAGSYPWTLSPIEGEFDPIGYENLVLQSQSGTSISLLPYLVRNDHFMLAMNEQGIPEMMNGTGYNNGTWYEYPNYNWWNVWFYDHPVATDRRKVITGIMMVLPRIPDLPSYVEIVYNWSTPAWPGWPEIVRPPLPQDVIDPLYETSVIQRSDPIFIWQGNIFEPIAVTVPYEILQYNPEWLSIDIRGYNFVLQGDLQHVCWKEGECGGGSTGDLDFGDAPEGVLAYPSNGVSGQFPTCKTVGPATWVQHNNFGAFFGPIVDFEADGNAGLCPVFTPNSYDQDECFNDGDAGLIKPTGFTIQNGQVVSCPNAGNIPLGNPCRPAIWGQSIDILVSNNMPNNATAYVNLLIDWSQDGKWTGSSSCQTTAVPEHVLVNFPIPNGYSGPLSGLNPPAFLIGPNALYVWSRFSISEAQVVQNWDGSGQFEDGETEDYLLLVANWSFDFGDAASSYPVTTAQNGARHLIMGNLTLGTVIDFEGDGLPSTNALGDDNNMLADEDGVLFSTPLYIGQVATLKVVRTGGSGNAYLQGWVDFNKDGDWADAGEKIFNNTILLVGSNTLTFTVPSGSTTGFTFARFRLSSTSTLSYTGSASDGEVEDYLVAIENKSMNDWGDAPDTPYPTLEASNGARHGHNPTGYYMGSLKDYEINGLPNATALGDDNNNSDDEDGVTFTQLYPGQSATATIVASKTGGFINAWIDFNADGDWNDTGEKIVSNISPFAGSNTFNFTVPANAVAGNTFSRIRYSNVTGIPFNGYSPAGEVEDYRVTIVMPPDYGDAPWPFPTTVSQNGAYHAIDGITYLGAGVDYEIDGQPDATATGDDLNGVDDEDGVVFTSVLTAGSNATVTVTASVQGYLFAWMDFNQDSDWNDYPQEHIFMATSLNAGANNLTFAVPANAVGGNAYARFRFLNQLQTVVFYGGGYPGEVEDYMVNIVGNQSDWGDAPYSPPIYNYPTLAANNGAAHVIVQGMQLGNLIDSEPDGQPGSYATGDDVTNLADEDGVLYNWPNNMVTGFPMNIKVNASTIGKLDAWMDFNADGDWNDAFENIFVSVPLSAGDNYLSFVVPRNASVAFTPFPFSARYRFSTAGGLSYTGYANDGEVEDYPIGFGTNNLYQWSQPYQQSYSSLSGFHTHDAIVGNQLQIIVAADDFVCHEGNISGIVWYGSYEAPGSGVKQFHLSLHNSQANCLPIDPEFWGVDVLLASVNETATGVLNSMNEMIYRYEYIFPTPLQLIPNFNYWVDISSRSNNPNNPAQWKWQESSRSKVPALCPAVRRAITAGIPSTWTPIYWSVPNTYSEMAFEILSEMDFGDAPSPYPTKLTNNGACHSKWWVNLSLGNLVDYESDGQPNVNANGDDLAGLPDEDGIVFLTPLLIGQNAVLQINVIGTGMLQGWIDFNCDGDWSDNGEQIIHNLSVSTGMFNHNYLVPPYATTGKSYARFRLCTWSLPPNIFNGNLPNGEVEDYAVDILNIQHDFGDAPDPTYPTILGSNGAHHKIDGVTFMGNLIDAEPDGLPSGNANGDDLNNLDDEDGVTIAGPLVVGKSATIKVKASVPGYLNAWMDFNLNGSWADAGDQIFTDQLLVAGINTLTFNVPAGINPGVTYSRFRFNTTGGLSYTGLAADGEVEDYKAIINPPEWSYIPTNSTHIIAIPANVAIRCVPLEAGDFIGTFYIDDNGNQACGGAVMWDGIDNQVLVAFGDDPTTPLKEGFDEEESFIWKVYYSSSGTQEVVEVEYDATLPDSDGKFHNNGLSAIISISSTFTVNAFSEPSEICAGDLVQLKAVVNGGCPPFIYSWTSDPPGFTSSLQNPTDTPLVTTTYYVAVTNGGGVIKTASISVTVIPLPAVQCPQFMQTCEGEPPVLLNTAVPQGGVYSGTGVFVDGGNYFFNPAVGPGVYLITYCYTDPETGCKNCCDFPFFVYALPVVECPNDITICIDTPPFELIGATPPGGIYSGEGVNGGKFYPAIAGAGEHEITYTYADPQSGCVGFCTFKITVIEVLVECPEDMAVCLDDPAFELTGATPEGGFYSGPGVSGGWFDPAVAGVGFHTITYTYVVPGTNCFGTCTFVIHVKPLPQVDCPAFMRACEGDPKVLLNTAYPQSGDYFGPGVSFDGGNYWFDPAIGVGTYLIHYCFTEPATGCTNCCEFNFYVHALPVVECPDDFTICIDTPPFDLTGATPPGGVYSGEGVSGGVFDPAAADPGIHVITYTYTNPNTGCTDFCTFKITVIEVLVECPEDMAVCLDDPAFELTGATPEGGFYSGPGVSGGWFDPAVAGVGFHTITYTYVVPGTNCFGTCTFVIHVKPLPQLDCPPDFEVCLNSPTILLNNAYPQGGEYSGEGVFFDEGFYWFDPSIGVGNYLIIYCFTDPVTGCTNCCVFVITVIADHLIEIPQGWSGISSYIIPDDPAMSSVLYPVTYPLIMLYNFDGMYYPEEDIYTLSSWDAYSGYAIKTSFDTNLPICGSEVTEKVVELKQGWNLIPVLSTMDYNIEILFSGVNGFQIAKDVAGSGVYWKDYGINTIGCVKPGKAYYVRMLFPGTINYSLPGACWPTKAGERETVLKTPWNEVINVPGSHLVAFNITGNPFEIGDIVGGFTTEGLCAGVTQITDNSLPFALSLNGDDALTAETDGFVNSEMLSYQLYRPATGEIFDLTVTYNPEMNPGNFESNGLSEVIQVKMPATGFMSQSASALKIYPNPSHGIFTITGFIKTANIEIMNAVGEQIYRNETTLPVKLDLSGRPNGVYLLKVETDNRVFIEKIVIN